MAIAERFEYMLYMLQNAYTNPQVYLCSCENNRFAKVLEHEGKSRRSKGHSVCPMQDDETIIVIIVTDNLRSHINPVLNTSVCRLLDGTSLFDVIQYPTTQLSNTTWIRESIITKQF